MAQVTIHVNAKSYLVGCEDGEEARLQALAAELDARVRALGVSGAALGETRLMLMGALVLADEVAAGAARVAVAEAETARLRAQLDIADARAVAALEAAARKIEAIASR
ncbi:MAG TPA: cell division protein ZapA [Caulobacteraceae bacterium]|jgi:cell division protein ZapA|nr:cell division protein ZapA [Caulobacteraceae bacterium]